MHHDDPLPKTMRVTFKVLLGIVFLIAIGVVGLGLAVFIQERARPSDLFIIQFVMSAVAGLLIASLTVYRVVTTPRFATLTVILTLPIMITLMTSLVFFWPAIEGAAARAFPWTEPLLNAIDWLITKFEDLFDPRSMIDAAKANASFVKFW